MTRVMTDATTTLCQGCGASTSNGLVLCDRCQKTAKIAVENIAAYHRELLSLGATRVETRRARGASDPTGALVVALETRERDSGDVAAAETKAELVAWVRLLIEDRPQITAPRDTVESMAVVLIRRTTTIATLAWANSYLHDVTVLERRLRELVQRSKGYWYAGICSAELMPERPHDVTACACSCHLLGDGELDCDVPGGCGREEATVPAEYCDRDLFAVPGATQVRCPACRTNHSVQARRTILLEEARETLLPLTTIATVCVSLLEGEPSVERLLKRISNWIRRGTLADYGVRVLDDRRPHRVYRLGDVLDTLVREASKTRDRSAC